MASYFRGVSQDQDGRWSKADEKLLQKLSAEGKFAKILDTKVNLKKVNMDVINRWIAERVTQLMGFEDDITFNTIINLLQNSDVDAKRMQISITAFLAQNAGKFMEDLWTLLADAQSQPSGIPGVIIEKKREEILKRESAKTSTVIPVPSSTSSAMEPQVSKGKEEDAVLKTEGEDSRRQEDSRTDRTRDRSDPNSRRRSYRNDENQTRERESRHDRSPERRRRADSASSSSDDSERKYRRNIRRREESSDKSGDDRGSRRRRDERGSGDRSRRRGRSDSRRRR